MKQSDWREALPAMSLGWELAIPIFLGVLLGYYADQQLGTKPLLTLGLLLLGAAPGIYNVIRFALRLKAQEQQRAHQQIQKQTDSPT